jgi:hypothetical protein
MNRRTWLLAALAGATGVDLEGTFDALAADKMSKAGAEYQESPKDIRMCATCTLFEPPRVQGGGRGREPMAGARLSPSPTRVVIASEAKQSRAIRLVPRTRSSDNIAASPIANFGFKAALQL